MRNVIVALLFSAFIQSFVAATAVAGTIGATSVSPASTPAGIPQVVTVTSVITDSSVIPDSVNLQRLDESGRVVAVIGALHDDGLNGDAVAGDKLFSIATTVLENATGTVRYRVSAGFLGSLLRVFSAPVSVSITGTATGISITSPANSAYVNTPTITIGGTVGDPAAQVNINGIAAPVSNNSFVTTVPLNEGPNTLTAVAANSNGTSSTASILVTLDTTPPRIQIYTPTNNGITTDASVTVTGLVNDIVVGTVNPQQAAVTVNGVTAQVLNRSFIANNVPLVMGSNTIRAVTADRAGNSATATAAVTRQAQTQTTLKLQSGNNQAGSIRSLLPSPLVVKLVSASGAPVANTPVVFRVTNQDGIISPTGAQGSGLSSVAVNTDAQGLASVFFTLGSHAGVGNHVVEASTSGVATTATFVASATPAPPGLVVIDSGNNQNGVIGQPLPLPFIAIVTDAGNNRLSGIKVTFSVRTGGGNFAGKLTYVTTTDSDGRAQATLTLGPDPGVSNNLVEVSFAGITGFPAAFTATGLTPGPASQTRISGVVLDNSNNPIPGVTMRLYQINQGARSNIPQEVAQAVRTDAQGQFLMQPVPVGVFKLMADGGTAQRPGNWPTLEYDLITVPGQDNTVGIPIYLPELLTQNRLCVNETTGGTLNIPQAPGFSLTIAPGSATFPGGSRSGCVSVTPVNMDKVPMAPGFGQQPRFIVTIQPVGTTFNPPAALTIPNVDGLSPRAVTEMYSYDHDLASFVSIGSATVSEDGSIIRSDPGVGVLKAGWHCGGNPNTTGSAGTCPTCKKCQGPGCVADSSQNGRILPDNKCKVCTNGNPTDIPINSAGTTASFTFGLPAPTVEKVNDGLDKLKSVGVLASVSLLEITGSLTTKECCEATLGKGKDTSGSVSGKFGSFSARAKVWPPGPIPTFGPRTIDIFGVASLTVKAEFVGGVFIGISGEVNGTVGRKKNECSLNAADRDGCFFAELKTTLTPSATAEVGGSGTLTTDCVLCDKTTISVSGSLVAGELTWPLDISNIAYNKASCVAGLSGGVFQLGSGQFKVSASFSGSYQPEGSAKRTISAMIDFVSCEIASSGVTCN